MKQIPFDMGFEGFYIWFNNEKNEEYFLTPLYILGDLADVDVESLCKLRMYSKRNGNDISNYELKNEEIFEAPFMRFMPYIEKMGDLLMWLLNTDFSNFADSYNNFYYHYGFELLYCYSQIDKLKRKYNTEKELYHELTKIHKEISQSIIAIQKDFKELIDFLYNLNDNKEYAENSPKVKFIASILKNKYNISKYINNTEIIHYTYSDKMKEYENMSFDDIIKNLSYDTVLLKVSDVYTSKFLGDIAFVILNQIIQNDLIIKTCQHCGRYFVPNKSNEIYCDRVYEDGRTCRELGALKTYKENLETNPGLLEYRRIYNKKSNRVSRNKQDKNLKKEFNIWKKNAQTQIKRLKKNEITEKELYEWMIENE